MDDIKDNPRPLSRILNLNTIRTGCKKCYDEYMGCTQRMDSTICSYYFAVCMQQCYE